MADRIKPFWEGLKALLEDQDGDIQLWARRHFNRPLVVREGFPDGPIDETDRRSATSETPDALPCVLADFTGMVEVETIGMGSGPEYEPEPLIALIFAFRTDDSGSDAPSRAFGQRLELAAALIEAVRADPDLGGRVDRATIAGMEVERTADLLTLFSVSIRATVFSG